jgi:hypothetical protein
MVWWHTAASEHSCLSSYRFQCLRLRKASQRQGSSQWLFSFQTRIHQARWSYHFSVEALDRICVQSHCPVWMDVVEAGTHLSLLPCFRTLLIVSSQGLFWLSVTRSAKEELTSWKISAMFPYVSPSTRKNTHRLQYSYSAPFSIWENWKFSCTALFDYTWEQAAIAKLVEFWFNFD